MGLTQEMVFVKALSGKTAMLPVPAGEAVSAVLEKFMAVFAPLSEKNDSGARLRKCFPHTLPPLSHRAGAMHHCNVCRVYV